MYGHTTAAVLPAATGAGFAFTGVSYAAFAILGVTLLFAGLTLVRFLRRKHGRP